MKYENIVQGKFIERPNRFIALVEISGKKEKVHVKNTGRCKELLVPGAKVFLEDHFGRMGTRKLRYSLIAVEKSAGSGSILINMDSQAPNKVVREALEEGRILPEGMEDVAFFKGEYVCGDSRLDFYGKSTGGSQWLAEVKGVTLEEDGIVMFPDAPTLRGVKHVEELTAAISRGYRVSIIFIIQMEGVKFFKPNDKTHPQFGEALRKAAAKGVEILAFDCKVEKDSLKIGGKVPVVL